MHWRLKVWSNRGARAEDRALKFLKQQGLKPLDRNYACRAGELDLIMLQEETLIFIEVRSRSPSRYGTAAETVTRGKQDKIRKTAAHFLQSHPEHSHRECRFDVITLVHTDDGKVANNDDSTPNPIEWFPGAF